MLALIPARERGALSATTVTEAMKRVNAAVVESERVAAEILKEDQNTDWYKRWAATLVTWNPFPGRLYERKWRRPDCASKP